MPVMGSISRLEKFFASSVSLFHSSSYAFAQSFLVLSPDGKFVYDDFYVVILISVDLHASCKFEYLTVHTNVEVAFSPHAFEKLTIVSFALSH